MARMQNHVNVLAYNGVTELENGDLAVVIEYCSKGSLLDALYGKRPRHLTSLQQLRIAHGAACGMSHLHDQGIVHRDIAARNVLLHTTELIPKLADFGMARMLGPGADDAAEHDESDSSVGGGTNGARTTRFVGPVRWMVSGAVPVRVTSRSRRQNAYRRPSSCMGATLSALTCMRLACCSLRSTPSRSRGRTRVTSALWRASSPAK